MEDRNYKTLDGLRGAAALSVVILHTPWFFGGWNLPGSFLAVDLFFVLSGFVLEAAYQRRFEAGWSWWRFTKVRLVRLYPLFLLGAALGVPVAVASLYFPGLSIDWSLTLLAASVPLAPTMLPVPPLAGSDALYPLNPVLWSIFFEVAVNLFYALTWRTLRQTALIISVILVSALAICVAAFATHDLNGGFSWGTFMVGVFRVNFSFFAGVLIFRMSQPRPKSNDRWRGFVAVALVALLPAIFAVRSGWLFDLLAILMVMPLLVFLASRVEPSGTAKQVFHVLGVSSYAVYALHKPVYQLLLGLMLKGGIAVKLLAPWLGWGFLVIIVAIAVLADLIFDGPARRWLSARFIGSSAQS